MRIFRYIRVSGLGQVDKDGPIRQREEIDNFCNRHALQSMAEFVEEGVSGTVESMDRPKFSDMLLKVDAMRNAGSPLFFIDAIVVERMDRLARDLMVSEFLLRECRNRNLKVFCVDQGELIDMASNEGDPTRVMLRQILGAIAQWEKSVTVKKLKAARARKRREAKECEGKKRYGRFDIEEFETKQEIRKLITSGLSYAAVADILNARGSTATRHGKKWNKSNVYTVDTERRTKGKINARRDNAIRTGERLLHRTMHVEENLGSGGSARGGEESGGAPSGGSGIEAGANS
jgi:DNA invertase Pin-like site-specific DNA recombinase